MLILDAAPTLPITEHLKRWRIFYGRARRVKLLSDKMHKARTMDNIRFAAPVFIGDTARVELEVIEVRPSKSRPGTEILKLKNTVKNQRDESVAHGKRL